MEQVKLRISVVSSVNNECYLVLLYIFGIFKLLFITKFVFTIFIFFGELSYFCNRLLTNKKQELVIRNCQLTVCWPQITIFMRSRSLQLGFHRILKDFSKCSESTIQLKPRLYQARSQWFTECRGIFRMPPHIYDEAFSEN